MKIPNCEECGKPVSLFYPGGARKTPAQVARSKTCSKECSRKKKSREKQGNKNGNHHTKQKSQLIILRGAIVDDWLYRRPA